MAQVTTSLNGTLQLIPLPASAPLNERLAWLTDVITSYNGTEQRLQVRNAPRRRFDMVFPASAVEYGRTFNTLYGERVSDWAVPMWTEAQRIGDVTGGLSTITVTTTNYDYRVNGLALLWSNARDWQIVETTVINPGSVDIVGTTNAFTAPYMMPVRVGRIVGTPTRKGNSYNADYKVGFELNDNIALSPSAPTQYLGDDFYTDEGLFAGAAMTDKFIQRIEVVDEDLGIVVQRSPWLNARVSRPYRWLLNDPADIYAFLEFLHRRAGRFRQFWLPSFDSDLRVTSTGTVTTVLQVSTDDYPTHASARVNIAVQDTAGTWYARVIDSTAPATAETLNLTLNSALNVDAGDIVRVSYLGLKRFEPDAVDLNWASGGVLEAEVRMLELTP